MVVTLLRDFPTLEFFDDFDLTEGTVGASVGSSEGASVAGTTGCAEGASVTTGTGCNVGDAVVFAFFDPPAFVFADFAAFCRRRTCPFSCAICCSALVQETSAMAMSVVEHSIVVNFIVENTCEK